MLETLKKLRILLHRFWDQLRSQGLVMSAWAGVDTIIRNITGSPIRRLSEITPKIFVGGQPAIHFWTKLSSWGVGAVVNMRGEYSYATKVDPLSLPLVFLHLPTVDNEAPSLLHLRQGVDFIREHIKTTGEGVYIHCWEGLGRGPTMAVAYLVSTGLTPTQAWNKVRETRPFIRPTAIQQAQIETFAEAYHPNEAPSPLKILKLPEDH